MRYLILLLSLMLLDTPATDDDFVPKDMAKAVAIGCEVSGVGDSPPFAEVQVFVRYDPQGKVWDYHPIISRRDLAQGGVLRAIDDCREWLEKSKKKIEQASRNTKDASK